MPDLGAPDCRRICCVALSRSVCRNPATTAAGNGRKARASFPSTVTGLGTAGALETFLGTGGTVAPQWSLS